MKKLAVILLGLSVVFVFGCSKTENLTISDRIESEQEEDLTRQTGTESETVPLMLPIDPEVSQSLYEASVSEDESLNELAARWDAVSEYMRDVMNTREFLNAETDEKKAEIIIDALKELSEHGTEKYPEPLVIYDSWTYIPEYKEVTALYSDGAECVFSWFDYNAVSTDVA